MYDNGFITDFDWTKWEPAEEIFKNHKLIKSLELLDIEFLLTTIIRKERFCEGVLMNAIDNGMILSILEQCRFLVNPEGELLYQQFIEKE